jgi:iron transport multicopper oxidase
MTIIETDGENTVPLLVDSIAVSVGQRYSVVLVANQPVGNYWIRANPDSRALPGFDGGRNSAILRYLGARLTDPTTTQTPNVNPFYEPNLHALTNPAAPGEPFVGGADVVFSLNLSFDSIKNQFDVNGYALQLLPVPVLLQILSGTQSVQDLLPKGSFYSLPPNKVIEVNIPGLPSSLGGPVSPHCLL